MFSFLKKKKKYPEAPLLKVDIHSHFIPSIDDGSQSIEESLGLLKKMQELGYEKVITTPHIMADTYRNTPEIIHNGLALLREAMKKENIDIVVEVAAEYYLDDGFLDLLEKGDLMLFKSNHLLFETSYVSKPLQIEEMIFAIASKGYVPVMAHPERYRYIKNPKEEYERFKSLGVLFQCNINSFGGHYGKSAYALATFLKENGMIDFLGSDAHGEKHLKTLSEVRLSDVYAEIFAKNDIKNNLL